MLSGCSCLLARQYQSIIKFFLVPRKRDKEGRRKGGFPDLLVNRQLFIEPGLFDVGDLPPNNFRHLRRRVPDGETRDVMTQVNLLEIENGTEFRRITIIESRPSRVG